MAKEKMFDSVREVLLDDRKLRALKFPGDVRPCVVCGQMLPEGIARFCSGACMVDYQRQENAPKLF